MTETTDAAAFWTDMAGSAALWATRHPGALEYVDDFAREWSATMRDPYGRAVLETACQQTQAAGRAQGGLRCCGTTKEWHRPWCDAGPRRFRAHDGRLRTMGYQIEQEQISVRLSRHNDERDERDNALWEELHGKISDLITDPRYADISPTLI